jgi:C4-dicarboxylate-specific signal transduction histidine kinase
MSTTEEPKSTNALLEMLINSLTEQAKERAEQRQQDLKERDEQRRELKELAEQRHTELQEMKDAFKELTDTLKAQGKTLQQIKDALPQRRRASPVSALSTASIATELSPPVASSVNNETLHAESVAHAVGSVMLPPEDAA